MKNLSHHRTSVMFIVLSSAILLALLMVGPSTLAGTQAAAGGYDVLIDDSYAANLLAIDSWLQQAKLNASDGVEEDTFGYSVAISGDTVVVGAWSGNGGKGIVYVFEKSGEDWISATETARLTASDGVAENSFGRSVAISGDTIVVGGARRRQ